MFNFDFLEGSGKFLHYILCMTFQEKCFSSYILLADHFSLPNCLYFLRYWSTCALQLFVKQFVASQILKVTLFSNQAVFLYYDQNVKTKIQIS